MTSAADTPAPRRRRHWLVPLVCATAVSAVVGGWWLWYRPGALAREAAQASDEILTGASAAQTIDMDKALELNNEGVGLTEQFRYEPAVAIFEKVVEQAPAWLPGRINLGIALLNAGGTSSPEMLKRTRETFEQVLRIDPDNRHAHHCLGVLLMYQKDASEAIAHFEAVTRLDPTDAHAWFFLGLLIEDEKRKKECFQAAFRHDPYHLGALYQLRLEGSLLQTYQDLMGVGWGNPSDIKYGEMGRYAEVIGKWKKSTSQADPLPELQLAPMKVKLARGATWAKPGDLGNDAVGKLRRFVRERFGGTVVTLDFDSDGRDDLFLAGAVVETGKVRDLLLRNTADGYVDVTAAAGLAGSFPALGATVADVDNDGLPDLLLTGVGVRLYRNSGSGKFEDVTKAAGLTSIEGVFLGSACVDLDQDSDLDLLVAQYAASPEAAIDERSKVSGGLLAFLNRSEAPPVARGSAQPVPLKLRFRPDNLFAKLGLDGKAVGVVAVDIDADRDIDLVALLEGEGIQIIFNDRLLRFRRVRVTGSGRPDFRPNGGLILDTNHTGRSDLLLLDSRHPATLWRSQAHPGQTASKDTLVERGQLGTVPLRQALAIDLNLDGWTDVAALSAKGNLVLLHNDGDQLQPRSNATTGLKQPARLIGLTALISPTAPVSAQLVLWSDQGLSLLSPAKLANHGLAIRLTGRRGVEPTGTSVRCNSDGIGTVVIAQAGEVWTDIESSTLSAGLGQSRPPLLLGLGRHSRADVVRLRWPDGTIQAELNTAAGRRMIRQQNRKTTSCPVLFAHDGKRFRFVTDFLGAGTMGERLPDGSTRPPRPEESVKIEPEQLGLVDGRYLIELAEPMDEVTYLDRLQLVAIDHPATVSVYPDERFAAGGPPPTQKLIGFDQKVFPVRAIDHHGQDVTKRLRTWNRGTVDGFAKRAWLGVAEEHHVVLDFGDRLKDITKKDRLFLCLAGWTDYPFPESILAASQAGVALVPPVLERQKADGKWSKVADAGFPAGLPRMMLLDITGLVGGPQCNLRLRTNLQVYWDQAFIAVGCREMQGVPLEVESATLGACGIHLEYSPDGRAPTKYAHDRFEKVPVVRLAGCLTRYGDVTELLRQTDDRFVLFGAGDRVRVRFDARKLPPVPAGWKRSFVLRTNGYCKDASPFTVTGSTVGPLPFQGMKTYPPGVGERYPDTPKHRDYLRRYNTRLVLPERAVPRP